MGSHCSPAIQNNVVQYEENHEINNVVQEKTTYTPIFTAKLNLNVDFGMVTPCNGNDDSLATERNTQESHSKSQQNFLPKSYFDDTQTIIKSNHLVYSNLAGNVLQDICPSEVASQKEQKKKKKEANNIKEENYEVDYDLMCNNDMDQFKFQQPAIMKYVDKQPQWQQKINPYEQKNLKK